MAEQDVWDEVRAKFPLGDFERAVKAGVVAYDRSFEEE